MPWTAFRRHPLLMPLAILALGLLLTFGFTALWTGFAIYNYERGWCVLLTDLTSDPLPAQPPAAWAHGSLAQRSTYHRWRVYHDLLVLRTADRCH